MNNDQHICRSWADTLHNWGLESLVAALLEGTGPLNLLGAQVVYVGQPLLEQILPPDHLNALANMLENPQKTQAFTTLLRQKSISE